MQVSRYGDWNKALKVIQGMGERLHRELQKAIRQLLEYTDRVVTKHLDNQDLPWEPLNEDYRRWKERKGYSEQIYTLTGTYRGNISIWIAPDGLSGAVGVKRTVKHPKSGKVYEIGYILEFGSEARNIPERPLWRPTLDEVLPKGMQLVRMAVRKGLNLQ